MHRSRLAPLVFSLVCAALAVTAQASPPEILAFVGEDTLTTVDLRIELNIMEKRAGEQGNVSLPAAEPALRRLIQNRLIIQEGYRMGLDQDFTVSNQVNEAVNSRCMGALLDSVALAVPAEAADLKEARVLAVRKFIADLMVKYDVQVDTTLLKSLDYGSSDQQMKDRLQNSDEILAVAPTGKLKVSAFSRIIRFTAFHGLEGKPDAEVRRDQIFNEWLSEAVTIHEARRLDLRQRPDIQLYATRLERSLMLEETLKVLLQFPFDPSADEIAAFHREHVAEFMNPAFVRMESLKYGTQANASAARERFVQGAKISWLKANTDGVVNGPSPFPNEFFEAGKLNLKPEQAVVGFIPEPYGVPGGWVLARVTEVQEPAPIPVENCRDKVLAMMKSDSTRRHMQDIIGRLEAAVEVRIQPDAVAIIDRYLAQLETGGSK